MSILQVLLVIMCCAFATSCSKTSAPVAPATRYFSSFGLAVMGDLPVVPQGEISRNEAVSRKVYYIAEYDTFGRLRSFTKMYNGKPEYTHSFEYDDRGRMKNHTTSRKD